MAAKSYISKILVLAGILLMANLVWGFSEPSSSPPSSNVPAPINIGPVKQTKSGVLGARELESAVFRITDQVCLRGNCISAWPVPAAPAPAPPPPPPPPPQCTWSGVQWSDWTAVSSSKQWAGDCNWRREQTTTTYIRTGIICEGGKITGTTQESKQETTYSGWHFANLCYYW